jgi:aspartate aminotransferase-like enzyme
MFRERQPWSSFDEQSSAIPGGTSLHPSVLREMQRPYVNPWSGDALTYFDETLSLLKRLFNTRNDVLVMMGPIRAAMDSVTCSLLQPGDKAAVAVNGHWSQLFCEMIRAHGALPVPIEEEWGAVSDPDKVGRALDSMDGVKALFVTHVETSTGVANPVAGLGKVARDRGLLYVVDAAQTLGGAEVRTDDWGADFCISGNHKCMSAPAGLSYVAISDRGWDALQKRSVPIQGWYTSLLVWRDVGMRRQSGYFTFPVSLMFGLRAALDLMFDMSLPELYRRYSATAKAIRQGVREMGLQLCVKGQECPDCDSPGRFCADTVTAIRYPAGIRHDDFARAMQVQFATSIGGTYGPLAGKAFRVGPTGLMQLGRRFTLGLLTYMGLALRGLGFEAELDGALEKADAVFAESEASKGGA